MEVKDVTKRSRRDYVHDVFLGVLPLMLAYQLFLWIAFLPFALQGSADFRQLYTAGYSVRTGHSYELYDYQAQRTFQNWTVSARDLPLPFIRPAYEALLFVPLSLLSYRAAYFTFLILNLVVLATTFRLLRPKMAKLAAKSEWLPAAVFASFVPVHIALMQGQDSILVFAMLSTALLCLNQRRELLAGCVAGAAIFK